MLGCDRKHELKANGIDSQEIAKKREGIGRGTIRILQREKEQ
jgi:hypothetical protein